jgi:hypothetical protein
MVMIDGVGCCASVRRWVSCHRNSKIPVSQTGDPSQDRGIPFMDVMMMYYTYGTFINLQNYIRG